MLALLLVLIAARRPRHAAYLFAGAIAICIVALATDVTDVGLLLGETLPIYAVIFMLAWGRALPTRDKNMVAAGADEGRFDGS